MEHLDFSFKKNESFYIREGWIEKALRAIAANPSTFSKNNGVSILGIGSNMVKGLKYWLNASGLILSKGSVTHLSDLGLFITKYDKYLESKSSWFLIHLNLVANSQEAPIFNRVFNSNLKTFSKERLFSYLQESFDGLKIKDSYISDDLTIFLKSYVEEEPVVNPEKNYHCPLSDLHLLLKNDRQYEKHEPKFSDLSPYLIAFCLSNFTFPFPHEGDAISFNIDDSMITENNPMFVFNLSKTAYLQYLQKCEDYGLLKINRTANINTVRMEKKILFEDLKILYSNVRG